MFNFATRHSVWLAIGVGRRYCDLALVVELHALRAVEEVDLPDGCWMEKVQHWTKGGLVVQPPWNFRRHPSHIHCFADLWGWLKMVVCDGD